MTTIKSLCALVLLCCSVSYGRADTLLTDPGPGPGAIVGGGGGGSVGFDFAVGSAPLLITALGLWDENLDGFTNSHVIGLWDNSGNLLAQAVVSIGTTDPLEGEFRYATLTPVIPGPIILSAGTTYVLGAAYLDQDPDHFKLNLSGDQATFDPAVTPGNARISSGGGFAFPDDNFGPGSFVGPNAQFTVVPEPETGVLLVLGLVFGGLFVHRRSKAASH